MGQGGAWRGGEGVVGSQVTFSLPPRETTTEGQEFPSPAHSGASSWSSSGCAIMRSGTGLEETYQVHTVSVIGGRASSLTHCLVIPTAHCLLPTYSLLPTPHSQFSTAYLPTSYLLWATGDLDRVIPR